MLCPTSAYKHDLQALHLPQLRPHTSPCLGGLGSTQGWLGAFGCLRGCCPLLGPAGFLWQLLSKLSAQAGQALGHSGHTAGSPRGCSMGNLIGCLFPPSMHFPLSSQSHLTTSPPTHCPGLLWPLCSLLNSLGSERFPMVPSPTWHETS